MQVVFVCVCVHVCDMTLALTRRMTCVLEYVATVFMPIGAIEPLQHADDVSKLRFHAAVHPYGLVLQLAILLSSLADEGFETATALVSKQPMWLNKQIGLIAMSSQKKSVL